VEDAVNDCGGHPDRRELTDTFSPPTSLRLEVIADVSITPTNPAERTGR
jgi:hypothetical protein